MVAKMSCAHLKSDAYQNCRRVWAWTLWNIDITIPKDHKGNLSISCKAVDSGSNTQLERAESIRGLANKSSFYLLYIVYLIVVICKLKIH